MATEPTDKWMIETNDRYNKIVTSVTSLATGSLMLPVLFLREFLGLPKEQALAPHLSYTAYVAWSCLALSILSGLIYSWLSVKWVKLAWGQGIKFSKGPLEFLMDLSFVAMELLFVLGIAASVWFFATVRVTS